MELGIVGLGRMGANMARRLMRDGHKIVAFDVNPDAVATLAARRFPGFEALLGYEPWQGPIGVSRNGVLVSTADGETAAFALWNLEERGTMFVGGGEKTYQGMIIGENSRPDDLDVNPLKSKQLTNVRSAGKDEAVRLIPPRRPTLEQAIAYIEEDELVEVTPKSIRLRKKVLNPSFRKKRVKED